MNINYTFKNDDKSPIVINGISNLDLNPFDYIDLSDDEISKRFQNAIGLDIKSKLEESKLIIEAIADNDLELFCNKIEEINKENKQEYIYLSCESQKGESDWYGDFNYLSNPLSKYTSCKKQCECHYMPGGGHGYGTAGIVVKTTKDFLELMGWEEDLKYKTNKEEFLRYKDDRS